LSQVSNKLPYFFLADDICGLYIGNYEAASNVELLRKYKIRAVLTASIETGLKYAEEVIHFHEVQ